MRALVHLFVVLLFLILVWLFNLHTHLAHNVPHWNKSALLTLLSIQFISLNQRHTLQTHNHRCNLSPGGYSCKEVRKILDISNLPSYQYHKAQSFLATNQDSKSLAFRLTLFRLKVVQKKKQRDKTSHNLQHCTCGSSRLFH